MKVTVEIDCTPDEARQFLGLPDLKPLQASLLAKMEAQMTEAASRFAPDAILKSWMSLAQQTPEQLTEAVGRIFRPLPAARNPANDRPGGHRLTGPRHLAVRCPPLLLSTAA
jgi:hypothetical protein